jgi:hypothetical protein
LPWEKVFISYDTLDRELVERIAACLRRIGIIAFLADRSVEAGAEIPEKIAFHINDSNCFVAILTSSSVASQWVNQEIGYAYAFRNSRNLLIIPLVESGVQFKGFLQAFEYIPLNRYDSRYPIYLLITRLRAFINRNLIVLKEIEVTCKACKLPFKIPLPSQDEINHAAAGNQVFLAPCVNPNCRNPNNLDSLTFDVL